ncbi:hypothetical protein, partial [Streptomyces sp. NPDC006134]|uniref:hypothetical protein n=1 Tax=Streptomyces sp. NPDC006134 TaxID=3154467 RepID=UPI0033DF3FE7
ERTKLTAGPGPIQQAALPSPPEHGPATGAGRLLPSVPCGGGLSGRPDRYPILMKCALWTAPASYWLLTATDACQWARRVPHRADRAEADKEQS